MSLLMLVVGQLLQGISCPFGSFFFAFHSQSSTMSFGLHHVFLYSLPYVASILIQTFIPLSQNIIVASSELPSIYTLHPLLFRCLEHCCWVRLAVIPYSPVQAPPVPEKSLRSFPGSSSISVWPAFPKLLVFKYSVPLLDLMPRFQIYNYHISLTLAKLSNLYLFNSVFTGILLKLSVWSNYYCQISQCLRSANYLYFHWLIFMSLPILCSLQDPARNALWVLPWSFSSRMQVTAPLAECPL